MSQQHFDYIIIGAGIAGASAAMRLSEFGRVALLERESQPGYHSTGRSAATYEPSYGPEKVRPMILASWDFLNSPPAGFADAPLLKPRGSLVLFRQGEDAERGAHIEILKSINAEFENLDFEGALKYVPILNPDYTALALFTDAPMDMDVDAIHQGYIRTMKSNGGVLFVNAEVKDISRSDDWCVETPAGTFKAPIIVNAAGAWADVIAEISGVKPVGLQPKRRSAMLVKVPDECGDISSWPLTSGENPDFYFKPDAGRLLLSPQDQTPSDPCDAWPEDLDIAYAIDRFETATTMTNTRPEHTWAGLRSFVPDEGMVNGFDPDVNGFFWLAGQGGFGIETSPAMSLIAGNLARGKDFPQHVADFGLCEADLSPKRLR
jgi:D-arginine dehydrogenase